jgi:hypothetical protein
MKNKNNSTISQHSLKAFLIKIAKMTAFTLIILCISIVLLIHLYKVTGCDFHMLNSSSVNYIVLYKYDLDIHGSENFAPMTLIDKEPDSIILTKKQQKKLINKWNYSYPIGLCKYIPTYSLDVILKNGNNRNFRVNGLTIKEKNDIGFRFLNDNNFFETVWKENKTSPAANTRQKP